MTDKGPDTPVRLAIFDVDGTLVDSQHHIQAAMAHAFASAGRPAPTLAETLRIVDCLTLWLTQRLMPLPGHESHGPAALDGQAPAAIIIEALRSCPGPIVLVGNEIGLGVIPLGAEVRAFVDALGQLNQAVAARCQRVTLMAAGLPLTLKDAAP